MTNEKIEITSAHIEAIRNKYPNAKDMNDEQIINSIVGWEKHFYDDGKSRNLISALAFPSFDEYLHFTKREYPYFIKLL